MSTIYVFFLIFWRLTKQQYLSISGVCVCVIFPYVMHHIDATRNSHHGAYIIVCAYIIYGIWVRSYVWSFLLLVLRITSAHINLHGAEILRRFLI